DFALAAAYAVDIGASVIQEALGAIDNTPLSRWAIDYAYDNHVAVVASAADENSYHHNFPGTNTPTLYVHAIRSNADKLDDGPTASTIPPRITCSTPFPAGRASCAASAMAASMCAAPWIESSTARCRPRSRSSGRSGFRPCRVSTGACRSRAASTCAAPAVTPL